jgi:hypothetical protein
MTDRDGPIFPVEPPRPQQSSVFWPPTTQAGKSAGVSSKLSLVSWAPPRDTMHAWPAGRDVGKSNSMELGPDEESCSEVAFAAVLSDMDMAGLSEEAMENSVAEVSDEVPQHPERWKTRVRRGVSLDSRRHLRGISTGLGRRRSDTSLSVLGH